MTELGQMISVVLAHAQADDIEAIIHWDGPGWYAATRIKGKDIYTKVSTNRTVEPDRVALKMHDPIWCNWAPFGMTVH